MQIGAFQELEEVGKQLFNEYEGLFCNDEDFLKLDRRGSFTTEQMPFNCLIWLVLNAIELFTLTWLIFILSVSPK